MEKTNTTNKNQGITFAIILSLFAVSLSALSIVFSPNSFNRLTILPVTSPKISATPTPTCEIGVNYIKPYQQCPSANNQPKLFKEVVYSCYDGSKGHFISQACRILNDFNMVAQYACNNFSNPYCNLTPTPTIACMKKGVNGCYSNDNCCPGLTCILNNYKMLGTCN